MAARLEGLDDKIAKLNAKLAEIEGLTAEEVTRGHEALGVALASGALRPVVGTELPLAEAAEAHRRVMAPGARGKIVLLMP